MAALLVRVLDQPLHRRGKRGEALPSRRRARGEALVHLAGGGVGGWVGWGRVRVWELGLGFGS